MRKVWIVTANSCYSKIYRAVNTNKLVEHRTFTHDESRLPARELVSDRKGRETMRGSYGTDTMEEKTPIKVKEATHFAEQISQFLHDGYNAGEVERLYLIAKPPFLGILRQTLNANVSKLIELEIHKDLIHLKPEQVREYLPPVL